MENVKLYSRKFAMVVFAVLVLFFVIPLTSFATSTSLSGDGTESSPFLIQSAEDLEYMRDRVNADDIIFDSAGEAVCARSAYYLVKNDIDLEDLDESMWTPIGGKATKCTLSVSSQADLEEALQSHSIIYDEEGNSYVPNSKKNAEYNKTTSYYYLSSAPFSGSFDGNEKVISDLNIKTDQGYAGLFGNVSGIVKNLTVNGSVESSTAQDFVGGIAGKLSAGGTIEGCIADVTVSAKSGYNVGGIVGFVGEPGVFVSDSNQMATVKQCVNKGKVTGYVRVGGIAGRNAGTITECANYGEIFNVSGAKKGTGGIVGMNGVNNTAMDAGIVSYCYNVGIVNGNNGYWTGGLIGFQNSKSSCTNSYNAGLLDTTYGLKSWTNPIVGHNEGSVSQCLWLNKESGSSTESYIGIDSTGVGNSGGTVTAVESKTDTELKAYTAVNFLGNDKFKSSSDNYPRLSFEE